jgi:hypothetical protein
MRGLCLDPVDVEVALGEQPGAVEVDEGVAVPEVREHQLALAVLGEQVVGDAVALAGRPVPVELDRALTVEVLCGLVPVEVLEYGRQRLAAVEDLGGLGGPPASGSTRRSKISLFAGLS